MNALFLEVTHTEEKSNFVFKLFVSLKGIIHNVFLHFYAFKCFHPSWTIRTPLWAVILTANKISLGGVLGLNQTVDQAGPLLLKWQ